MNTTTQTKPQQVSIPGISYCEVSQALEMAAAALRQLILYSEDAYDEDQYSFAEPVEEDALDSGDYMMVQGLLFRMEWLSNHFSAQQTEHLPEIALVLDQSISHIQSIWFEREEQRKDIWRFAWESNIHLLIRVQRACEEDALAACEFEEQQVSSPWRQLRSSFHLLCAIAQESFYFWILLFLFFWFFLRQL